MLFILLGKYQLDAVTSGNAAEKSGKKDKPLFVIPLLCTFNFSKD